MKTVMKKMFCLMLVAVLMVGVMPFQAFADGENPAAPMRVGIDGFYHSITATSGQTSLNVLNQFLSAEYQDSSKYTVTWLDGYTGSTAAPGAGGMIEVYALSELPGYPDGWVHTFEAQITKVPATCGTCSNTYYPADGQHTCPPLTCENCNTQYERNATHTVGVDCCSACNTADHNDAACSVLHPECQYCHGEHQSTACTELCPTCKNLNKYTIEHDADDHCSKCGASPNACPLTCTNNPNYHTTCTKCQVQYITANGHTCCDRCKELHATANCPYCTTCWAKGDKVTTHATSAHCTTCNGINGHLSGYPCYTAPAAGNVNLYVWANLYTGQVKTGSVLLDTITGLSGSEHVYQVVANNEGRIRSKIPAGYGWTGHIYYEQDPKTVLQVHSNLTVGAEDDVVINLYTDQKLVVARVHTNKTYAIDHTINVDGFTVGQTVTSNDVLKAVQKHYNVSSLKMYTPAEWEKVVSGKTGTVIPNYEVHGGDNIIDVYVTGSYKTTSGTTYKADSSNPKTGDMIFAPAMVLGLSASALAVLFYLNKKRAF